MDTAGAGWGGTARLVAAARRSGVRDQRVLDAIRHTRRDLFVPEERVGEASIDAPVRIACGQVTTQPSLVAAMVAALSLRGGERVLEIGTGLGYQAAVLGALAGEVYSVERFAALAEAARQNLAAAGIDNVEVVVGDGSGGLPEHAPYDAIVLGAAFPRVPAPLAAQLRRGGRLVQPVGPGGAEDVILFEATAAGLEPRRTVSGARFVRLVGEHGYES